MANANTPHSLLSQQIQTQLSSTPQLALFNAMQSPTPPLSVSDAHNTHGGENAPGRGSATNAAPSSQTPGHPSFRRQRASRACETCHARKVRCDAASLGVPCTNCVAFSIECRIPAPKRKKTGQKNKDSDSERGDPINDAQETTQPVEASPHQEAIDGLAALQNDAKILGFEPAPVHYESVEPNTQRNYDDTYAQVMKPKFVRAPIKEAGRVAYLGESSNLSLLVHDRHGTTDVVHYPLPDTVRGSKARLDDLDQVDIDILHQKGAFLLPPRALCDELIESFFTWISPTVPVINRSRFMRRYRDAKNPPSLLLLQAMLLAGSRVCTNPQLMDSTGSTTPAAMTFYKRAKALFDANYEDDRVTIVQSLILMGWYWEGPEDVTRNVFYWTRVAIIVAQGSGMHRSVESSQLSKSDKRLWKRIWWTLFTRDRSVAVALGRPCCINTEDSDVEMVSVEDFNDDDIERPAEFKHDPIHIHFFLNYVKLCEIMGLVLAQQYSVACKARKHNALDLTHSDMALADWLQNCPKEVSWERQNHHFWSALLHANYYTTLCLLHRAHMPPAAAAETPVHNGYSVENPYPSRNIAYQAAAQITSIIESLQGHNELRFTPAFIVYSLFSALIMHVYQMRSSNMAVVTATEARMATCMDALRDVSKVWLVAKMVHTLFQSILGNKLLEERLQKAAGNRHKKKTTQKLQQGLQTQDQEQLQSHKRKYDEVDDGFSNSTPAPQLSYERSRPQTPAITPSREFPPAQPGMPPMTAAVQSPDMPRHDAFMGNSRNATRPTSPFNQFGRSYPGTPPDLFLVTRNSPTIPQDLWNNFQPDQLFPADTNMALPDTSPQVHNNFIDPQLSGPQLQSPPLGLHQQQSQLGQQMNYSHMHQMQQEGMPRQMRNNNQAPHLQQSGQPPHPMSWAQVSAMNQQPQLSAEDTWSNSSMGQGPIVPTTLNVEDWFQFFGIHGQDMNMNQRFNLENYWVPPPTEVAGP